VAAWCAASRGVGHGDRPELGVGVGVGDRPQVAQQRGATPGVHRREVGVAGVAVADQDPGELRQHPAGVDIFRAAPADVHQGQVLGARHMHIGQRAGSAAGGLVGVQHWRIQQQRAQMWQEGPLQPPRRAAPDPGQEPGGHIDPAQRLQQVPRPAHRQVVRAGQQRRPARVCGPIRTGEPGAATVAARRSPA